MLCAVMLFAAFSELAQSVETQRAPSLRPCVTVDAGHGGFDGGATAPDGTQEKTLNLAVAQPLGTMLTLCGWDVTMTRTDDTALSGENGSIRERKVSDMNGRLELYEEADINIAIHQNMFSSPQSHGAQVFYSVNHPFSKSLAQSVREELVRSIQPDNTREIKAGNRTIFLLHKTTKPTVLVECGFLSNAAELKELQSEEYQQRMAFAVACGTMRYAAERGMGE